MASYMFDTNIVIRLRQRRWPYLTDRAARLPVGEAVMSVITYGELRNGAEKSDDPSRVIATLEAMASIVSVKELSVDVGEEYGRLRSGLERRGTPIGSNDLWIAAHALVLRLVLVTDNEREFRRVPGLAVENWAAARP